MKLFINSSPQWNPRFPRTQFCWMRLLPGSCCWGPCRWGEGRNLSDQTGRETWRLVTLTPARCQDQRCWTKTSFTFLIKCWQSLRRIWWKLSEASLCETSAEVFVGMSSIYKFLYRVLWVTNRDGDNRKVKKMFSSNSTVSDLQIQYFHYSISKRMKYRNLIIYLFVYFWKACRRKLL